MPIPARGQGPLAILPTHACRTAPLNDESRPTGGWNRGPAATYSPRRLPTKYHRR